ncbi:hypothetical protein [Nostoc sp.]|uniref:hypothetical protein n=1 Tax=Nostoc sp. TaxID=1180 RepID=UPI002FFA4390
MADSLRKSSVIQAELLFLDGIYIFHHRDKEIPEAHVYKSISSAALRTMITTNRLIPHAIAVYLAGD